MTHHCTTCNRQVLHDGTTCCVCAEGELAFGMPEPDCYGTSPTHDPDIGSYNEWHGWYVGPDGITSIERYAQAKAAEAERLREIVDRLPVTADGVPIEIGQVYFYRDWADDRPPLRSRSVQVKYMRVQLIEIDHDGSVSYSGPCSVPWRAGEAQITIEVPSDLYSTPEAALAARNDTTDDV